MWTALDYSANSKPLGSRPPKDQPGSQISRAATQATKVSVRSRNSVTWS